MIKKKHFGLILSLFVTVGAMVFSTASNKGQVVKAEDEPTVQFQFNSISWDNVDYSYEWCGDLNSNNSPLNGYCVLAFFNEVGKTVEESKILPNIFTTGRGIVGQGYNVDTKVKVNGVDIIDVLGSKFYVYPTYGLFFYLPEESLTYDETYEIPTITIEAGAQIGNSVLPYISFEFRGEMGQTKCWTYTKDPEDYNHFDFVGVAPGWNNAAVDSSHNHTVIQFGEWGVDYLKADGISSDINLVNKYSDCGKKITVNGTPLYQIEEALVSYIHGYCYVYFVLPVAALHPSNGYKIVTFHIEANTVFYDTMLPEVYLYLFKGEWVLTRPETPEDNDYVGAFSLSNIFSQDEVTLNNDNRQIAGTKESDINHFGLFIDYKLMNSDSSFSIYALGKKNQAGLRLIFRENTFQLYDATSSNSQLASGELTPFDYDEWYSLFLYTRIVDNRLSIYIAIDDITYIHLDNVRLDNASNIGDMFSILLGNGEASFKNAVLGADNKKPTLTYTGKALYGVLSGSEVIDFTNKCSAYDVHDGNVTNLIQYNWPEGAISGGRLNKGTWLVSIVAPDMSGNKAHLEITVIATDKLDVTVTFDGENPTTYRIGDHIASISDPVKEGDGITSYRFIGWYYNDILWDFENDYIVKDMNLVSKFQETVEEYLVIFQVEGLKGTSSYTMYFAYGTRLNMDIFEKEGYSLKAYVNDEEVESIIVTSNLTVRLVYKSNNPHKDDNKGCGGNIAMTSVVLSTLALAGFSLILIKRGGKKHE